MKRIKSFFARLLNRVPGHQPLRYHDDPAVRRFFTKKSSRVR